MDPDVARHLFKNGAVLIMTGVPVATEFGIDLSSYAVGERFRGVKMIPAGPHFVYCASQDAYGGVAAPRVGFIHYFQPSEIVIREWDPQKEEMRLRRTADTELEKQRIRENLEELDRFLAPYAYSDLSRWKYLTDTITEEIVVRCSPECGFVRTSVEFLSCPDSERPRGGYPGNIKLTQQNIDENDLLPALKPIPGTALNFTAVPSRVPKGASPAEITHHHMDCIEAVASYFERILDVNLAMQENQLAFIFFCSGHSLDGLGHWRKILNILSNSETAVGKYKIFYMKYLEVLQYQLPELPEELMEPTDKNSVYRDVRNLLVNCTIGGLHVSADRLAKRLKKSMKWSFSGLLDEDPDDMPVIVENLE